MHKQLQLATSKEDCEVELQIFTNSVQRLRVYGFDRLDVDRRYFDRNVDTVSNSTVLRFGCPLAPKDLEIKVETLEGQRTPVQFKTKINDLEKDFVLSKSIREFCEFAQEFSTNYSKYPPKVKYKSRSGRFKIRHVPSIIGSKETPARIHKTKHFIEVSHEWFSKFTIPMRVFVLCHEFAHVYMNKRSTSEPEADVNGAKCYLSMGYPTIELIYSFTKIFGDSPQTHMRARNIVNWIKENG